MARWKFLPSKGRQAELALIAVTVVWGLTFALVKRTLESLSPFVFMTYRFFLAFLAMLAVSRRTLRSMNVRVLAAGSLLGLFLYAAYSFQTFGLKYTSAGNAGFITGLFVVFVPILSTLILKKRPRPLSILSVAVAVVGLGFLSLQPGLRVNSGDLLVLACAFTYSLHIIYMDRFVAEHDLALLTLTQMGVVALLQAASALLFEDFVLPRGGYPWMTIAVCGVLASAAAFFIQAWAQRHLSPVRTSVVLIMEPVFSVFFGMLLLGERLTWRGWLGCGLMLAGMLITEIRPERPTSS
ncbi:DMT family transporter [Candidatus Solincola tengchongensis]|uniref:DMT family transporter n=1 Tax=Candidatus Solincola tengchongensis TaxID=2900693 RepID=UPI00257B6526|nr:DMT family transporter [Candidatus Solincola tengchongensis]